MSRAIRQLREIVEIKSLQERRLAIELFLKNEVVSLSFISQLKPKGKDFDLFFETRAAARTLCELALEQGIQGRVGPNGAEMRLLIIKADG